MFLLPGTALAAALLLPATAAAAGEMRAETAPGVGPNVSGFSGGSASEQLGPHIPMAGLSDLANGFLSTVSGASGANGAGFDVELDLDLPQIPAAEDLPRIPEDLLNNPAGPAAEPANPPAGGGRQAPADPPAGTAGRPGGTGSAGVPPAGQPRVPEPAGGSGTAGTDAADTSTGTGTAGAGTAESGQIAGGGLPGGEEAPAGPADPLTPGQPLQGGSTGPSQGGVSTGTAGVPAAGPATGAGTELGERGRRSPAERSGAEQVALAALNVIAVLLATVGIAGPGLYDRIEARRRAGATTTVRGRWARKHGGKADGEPCRFDETIPFPAVDDYADYKQADYKQADYKQADYKQAGYGGYADVDADEYGPSRSHGEYAGAHRAKP